jgi:hypothetical protein
MKGITMVSGGGVGIPRSSSVYLLSRYMLHHDAEVRKLTHQWAKHTLDELCLAIKYVDLRVSDLGYRGKAVSASSVM